MVGTRVHNVMRQEFEQGSLMSFALLLCLCMQCIRTFVDEASHCASVEASHLGRADPFSVLWRSTAAKRAAVPPVPWPGCFLLLLPASDSGQGPGRSGAFLAIKALEE